MDANQFKILNDKFDRALRLLALNVVSEAKGDDQIRILAAAGFGPGEIAVMLGKTRNSVDQALHRLRRGGGQVKEKKQRNAKGVVSDVNETESEQIGKE